MKYKDSITIEVNEKAVSENTAYPRGKNNRRYLTQEGKDYKNYLGMLMKKELVENSDLPEGYQDMAWDVHLFIGFGDRRTRDMPNYEKLIFDAFTGILWQDDDYEHIPYHFNHYKPTEDYYIKIKCLLLENPPA